MLLRVALGIVALAGCTDGLRGVRMEMPKATGKPVASVTANEPGGLLVFWNGESMTHPEAYGVDGGGVWIAGNDDEFRAVWKATASGPPPRVDFAKYVVLAALGEGNYCEPKILGIDAESSGLLTLRYADQTGMECEDIAIPVALIIGIPRRVLTATVVFLEGYAFEVPEIPFG
jgi:hypothetical protein